MQSDLIANHKDRIHAELLLARLRQLDGEDAATSLDQADDAIARLESRLADVSLSDAALVRESDAHRESAVLYLALASGLGDEERIFRAMQLANISELARRQDFARDGSDQDGDAQTLRNELLDLARQQAELSARLDQARIDATDTAGELTAELASVAGLQQVAERALLEEHPDFVARYRPVPVALADLRTRLGADEILVAPVEGDLQGWLVRVSADGVASHALEMDNIAASVATLRAAVDAPQTLASFPQEEAHALFAALFPDGVAGVDRVLVYGGRSLATLPLGMLVTEAYTGDLRRAPWLARMVGSQTIGNLALFSRADAQSQTEAGRRFVGVGGIALPGSDGGERLAGLFRSGRPDATTIADLPELPGAAGELNRIAASFPPSARTLMIGPDASEARFKAADLQDIAVLAFATHGLVAGELADLWEPALLLRPGEGDSGDDGLLGASEIAGLAIDADWVILSACNTAAGSSPGAPSFGGLAAAFAQAGARSLLLSHWRVRDDAAAYLSARTVEIAAQGRDRAEALRQAQVELMENRTVADAGHPSVWAPFILIEN
ncbi:CHAT domain-containing protein [Pseudoblastomonas halimionae]|uniref:CHAT domain-containing protein n=1 Tax=Alteriqipengyuania halimionae TaxID=1926630 RepID=A0A6I4U753_9SPHN|nr:CHAT domain-containing protein [Alteriqipengyuania halimionae]MXP10282.1 CHAT domain-containing protein [Alteriqipengyuania halimionae]